MMTPTIDRQETPVTIDFRVRGIECSDEMREAVERIIAFAVDRYDSQVEKVSVTLVDVNGPKGGVDKLCQITARLTRGNPVLILEKGTEILSAVNRAARRLDHRIGRRVQRYHRPHLQTFRKSIRTA
jgi:putative sigma-54 modulation protein